MMLPIHPGLAVMCWGASAVAVVALGHLSMSRFRSPSGLGGAQVLLSRLHGRGILGPT